MNNKKYESPEVSFQEMKLLERVADTCWGLAYAWYDVDGDHTIDGKEKVYLKELPGLKENGCQGKAARDALINYFYENFGITLNDNQVSTNTDSPNWVPLNS